jgi:hypothetical protein
MLNSFYGVNVLVLNPFITLVICNKIIRVIVVYALLHYRFIINVDGSRDCNRN